MPAYFLCCFTCECMACWWFCGSLGGGVIFFLVLFFFLERVHLLLVVVNRTANISNMIGRITPGVHSISN